MPGVVMSFKVVAGQTVKKGDVVLILEAMKMENEIVSPQDGTVLTLHVPEGASVNTGDSLIDLG
jgi:biotin carboxyl carrier protein